jgi:tetratricopeptide (TPR) repeat protein
LAKDLAYRLLYDNDTIKVCDAQSDLLWVHEHLAKVADPRFNKPGRFKEAPEVYDLTPTTPFTALRYVQGTLEDVTPSFFLRAGEALKLHRAGLEFQRQGDHPRAINAFAAARETLGEYFEFLIGMSQSFAALKQFDQAIKAADYARQLSYPIGQVVQTHANAMAWYNLADVCRQAGKFNEAEGALKNAYEIDSQWVIQRGGFEKLEISKRMGPPCIN